MGIMNKPLSTKHVQGNHTLMHVCVFRFAKRYIERSLCCDSINCSFCRVSSLARLHAEIFSHEKHKQMRMLSLEE